MSEVSFFLFAIAIHKRIKYGRLIEIPKKRQQTKTICAKDCVCMILWNSNSMVCLCTSNRVIKYFGARIKKKKRKNRAPYDVSLWLTLWFTQTKLKVTLWIRLCRQLKLSRARTCIAFVTKNKNKFESILKNQLNWNCH